MVSMCVFVCACTLWCYVVWVCVCIPMHTCAEVRTGHRISSNTLYCIALNQGLSHSLYPTISARLTGQWAFRIYLSLLAKARVISTGSHVWPFTACWGFRPRSLCLLSKCALANEAIFPAPDFLTPQSLLFSVLIQTTTILDMVPVFWCSHP